MEQPRLGRGPQPDGLGLDEQLIALRPEPDVGDLHPDDRFPAAGVRRAGRGDRARAQVPGEQGRRAFGAGAGGHRGLAADRELAGQGDVLEGTGNDHGRAFPEAGASGWRMGERGCAGIGPDRGGGQPFTAPAVMPATSLRWMSRKNAIAGSANSVDPAMRPP